LSIKKQTNQMKQTILPTLALLFFFFLSNAQPQPVGHLTVFSDEGDKFFLILNGERQNDKAQTNMRVEDLNQPQYSAKIIFEDQTLGEVSKTLWLTDGSGALMDVTYKVKRDKNGKPKLGALPFSAVPVRQGFVAPSNVYVVHHGSPAPATTTVVTTPAVTQTTTTTTHTTGETVGANVNVGGVNMNVTISDPLLNTNVTTTHTTTTTTTNNNTVIKEQVVPVGCVGAYPMASADFSSALSTVKNQGFDETRLQTAKQIAGGNCLSTPQISEICKVFGFEETKLDFAKFAYDHCTEPKNYFKINNVFGFSSSVDDLTGYISGKH
jgi:hypothetical protein